MVELIDRNKMNGDEKWWIRKPRSKHGLGLQVEIILEEPVRMYFTEVDNEGKEHTILFMSLEDYRKTGQILRKRR